MTLLGQVRVPNDLGFADEAQRVEQRILRRVDMDVEVVSEKT
jgi:hypothetical protein